MSKKRSNEEILQETDYYYGHLFDNPEYDFFRSKILSGEIKNINQLNMAFNLGGIRTPIELIVLEELFRGKHHER